MIQYRSFVNTDPPGLVDVWNASFTARGAAALRSATLLEYFLFAKSYFDPEGLIVAADGRQARRLRPGRLRPGRRRRPARPGRPASSACSASSRPTASRASAPSWPSRAEDYLRRRGARTLFAGPMEPLNPFTFGLYGGSQSPGFLDSDAAARPFFEQRGYQPHRRQLVFERPLDRPPVVADGRFAAYRPRYEIQVGPRPGTTWWQECVFGPLELHDYRLTEKATGKWVARASLWEMETVQPDVERTRRRPGRAGGSPDMRRKGLGKFLMAQILRHLHEQFFTWPRSRRRRRTSRRCNLIRGLGFTQVDRGCRFRQAMPEA